MAESEKSCEVIKALAFFYQTYFRKIAFKALPQELEKMLGETAFGIIVRLVSMASIEAVPTMAKMMGFELEVDDPLKAIVQLNNKCHVELYQETSKIGEIGDIGLIPTEIEDNKIKFVLSTCPKSIVEFAPSVGIVVGIMKGFGLDVTALKDEKFKGHAKTRFVVYPKREGDKCMVVVERIR